MKVFRKHAQRLSSQDVYLTNGKIEYANFSDMCKHMDLESDLQQMVRAHYRHETEEGNALLPDLTISFSKTSQDVSRI